MPRAKFRDIISYPPKLGDVFLFAGVGLIAGWFAGEYTSDDARVYVGAVVLSVLAYVKLTFDNFRERWSALEARVADLEATGTRAADASSRSSSDTANSEPRW
jgi:hypothetical protein